MRLNCAAGFVAARGHWHPHFPLYKHPSQLLKKIFNVKHRKSIMLKRLKWAVLPRVLVLDRPSVWGSSSVALSSHQTPWRLCIETLQKHTTTRFCTVPRPAGERIRQVDGGLLVLCQWQKQREAERAALPLRFKPGSRSAARRMRSHSLTPC